jgi:hypothetical protein
MLVLGPSHRVLQNSRVRQCGGLRRRRYRTVRLGAPAKFIILHRKIGRRVDFARVRYGTMQSEYIGTLLNLFVHSIFLPKTNTKSTDTKFRSKRGEIRFSQVLTILVDRRYFWHFFLPSLWSSVRRLKFEIRVKTGIRVNPGRLNLVLRSNKFSTPVSTPVD